MNKHDPIETAYRESVISEDANIKQITNAIGFGPRVRGAISRMSNDFRVLQGSLYYYLRGQGFDQLTDYPQFKKQVEEAEKLLSQAESKLEEMRKILYKTKI